MSLVILYSNIFYKHNPPRGLYHPESSKRMDIALHAIVQTGLLNNAKGIDVLEPHYYNYIKKVHSKEYISLIEKISSKGEGFIDSDTYVNQYTFSVATHALGCSVYAMDLALRTKETMVFALVRPPGHHAGLYGRAMGAPTQGFCIFNNVAAAAMYAIDMGFKPMVIIDIDVHHGNGTQEIFWSSPEVIHIDIHEDGIYPGTGSLEDLGEGEGYGTKINIPLYPYSNDDDYIYVFQEVVLSIINNVKPKSLAISAGFDAYIDDGLASMKLTEKFYKYFGSLLRLLSKELNVGIAAILEGGYSVGLENGLTAFLKSFINPIDIDDASREVEPSKRTLYVVKKLSKLLKAAYILQ